MQPFNDATPPRSPAFRIRGLAWALVRPFFDFVPFLAVLLFFGALFWAKSQDPFSRRWLTLKTTDHQSVKCVTVLPKTVRQWRSPVVIYAHGSGDSLMNDGNALRQMAEMGLATVSLEFDQTSEATFAGQFETVLHYVADQDWVDTNAVAWVGFSLGANRMLDFAVQHPGQQPKLMVQLSGAGVKQSLFDPQQLTNLHCAMLLVHGEQDQTFPLEDTERLAAALRSNGVPAELKIVPGAPHGMEPDTGVVFRCIGEYCLTHLTGTNAWQNYLSIAQFEAEAPWFWLFCLPAAAWVIFGFVRFHKKQPREKVKLTKGETALRWLAGILVTWALTVTAIHLVPPHFLVSNTTLSIARQHLVEPKESADFEFLAAQPIWSGQRLKTLLDHVELAGYNRELINWQLDDKIYRDYVLSPIITSQAGEQMKWRRPLWEEFYPRIRHENSTEDAARIVARHLRERVTIAAMPGLPHEIPVIWLRQITDEPGFEIIHVAALRSVGVPARLNGQQKAEFWNGREWAAAPEPAVISW
jgi:dienelactone hydrolase